MTDLECDGTKKILVLNQQVTFEIALTLLAFNNRIRVKHR